MTKSSSNFVSNKMSKYLPSIDGYGRVLVTSSYHHHNLIRMKSSDNGGKDRKNEFEQKIMMDVESTPATRQELNRSFAREISDMRKDLKSRRNWEYTQFGHLVGTASDQQRTIGDGVKFSVMSYNILSQHLLSSHANLYRECDVRALNHSFRKQLLFNELDDINPDILCLQEVEETDFHKIFEPTLFLKGYKGVYKKRTGNKSDGCAIFYKTTRFSFVDKLAVEYFQPHIPLLNRDNVALLVKLTSFDSTGRRQTFVVGTTHLLFNPKRSDVKLGQTQLLLAELDRFAFHGLDHKGNSTYFPVILTGDFNADPYSSIIKFMTEGYFNSGMSSNQVSSYYNSRQQGLKEFIPIYSGISDQCQHYKLVLERINQWHSQRRSNIRPSSINTSKIQQLVNIHSSDTAESSSSVGDNYSTTSVMTDYSHKHNDDSSRSKLSSRSVTFSNDHNELISSETGYDPRNRLPKSEMPDVKSNSQISTKENSHLVNELDVEVHQKILKEIHSHGIPCTFECQELTHALRLSNVYGSKLDRPEGAETGVTTKQSFWTTVDYIFYSKIWNDQYKRQTEGKLRLIRRLGLLTRNQCKDMGPIPNLANSSDHFSLVAEFVLK